MALDLSDNQLQRIKDKLDRYDKPGPLVGRFLLFGGCKYYPSGGMDDLIGSYDTEAECVAAVDAHGAGKHAYEHFDWWHIYDSESGKIVQRRKQ